MKLILLMALTADGKIARNEAHFPNWTGKADKAMFKRTTQRAGVIIMGSKTFATIGKPLPNRLNVVLTRRPEQYQSQTNLVFTSDNPRKIMEWLASQGYDTAVLAGGATINSLFLKEKLIDELIITVTPVLFGQGLSLFTEPANVKLALLDSKQLDSDAILLHYRIHY